MLRHHIFGIFGPPSPLRNHVFSHENNQKMTFSDLPPPLKVITEGSCLMLLLGPGKKPH